jgi:GcrA cell cycle regulator
MGGTVMIWDKAHLEMLEIHFTDGLSASESAKLINVHFSLSLTRNAVIGKRHRLGMVRKISYMHYKTSAQRAHDLAEQNAVNNAKKRLKRAEKLAAQKSSLARQNEIISLKEAVRLAMETEKEQPIAALSTHTRDAVMALKANSCRFPIGIVGAEDFHFCCQPQDAGSPYCKTHRLICTVVLPVRARMAA